MGKREGQVRVMVVEFTKGIATQSRVAVLKCIDGRKDKVRGIRCEDDIHPKGNLFRLQVPLALHIDSEY